MNAPRTQVLIIGPVWPEPRSSAAGLRSCSLIRTFREAGWEIHFASSAKEGEPSQALRDQGIAVHTVAPNDPGFDAWIAELRPDFVIFERFMIEEQFGWRVREHSPGSVRVLETCDLHFLRRARQAAFKSGASIDDIASCRIPLVTEDALREAASIYRSDLALVISEFELELLTAPNGPFRIPSDLIREFSFCYDPPPPARPDDAREGFAMIGNFRHEPNADAVLWLKNEIWPLIHRRLPRAQVRVYGAYPPREMMALTDERTGFLVCGPAKDQYDALAAARVNLAPLRFGAGLKGKISDGWWAGTPCVTTPIGAEGMTLGPDRRFGELVASEAQGIADAACRLYEDADMRDKARQTGYEILSSRFGHETNARRLLTQLEELRVGIQGRRERNFVGRMLGHHLHQSTKHLARMIELKNRI
jgi:glycosyltransferase involved in cell wall biosynthesis